MEKKDMKHIGIWIDKREAKIISNENENVSLSTIQSELEEMNPKGGSGTRFKGGPQDVVQDSKFLNREKHHLAEYFRKAIEYVIDADELVIFGPAETGQRFYVELENKHPHLYAKVKSVEKADVMTENQLKAWVKDYFNLNF